MASPQPGLLEVLHLVEGKIVSMLYAVTGLFDVKKSMELRVLSPILTSVMKVSEGPKYVFFFQN